MNTRLEGYADGRYLTVGELDSIRKYTTEKRKEGRNVVQNAAINYHGIDDGDYYDIVQEFVKKIKKHLQLLLKL